MTQAMEAMDSGPDLNVAELLKFKLTLQEKLTTLAQVDNDILEIVAVDELDDEIEQSDVFKEKIQLVLINIETAIGPAAAEPAAAGGAPDAAPLTRGYAPKVRLPKITMKQFNSDLTR
jgi:hypothetical protein